MSGKYLPQTDKEKYASADYMTPKRWSSYSIIIKEVLKIKPRSILEIGPGNGVVASALRQMGFFVKTLDFDDQLGPDYVADISDDDLIRKLGGNKFDLVIAAEVLEHIHYEDFLKAIGNLARVSKKAIVSLPHTTDNSFFVSFIVKLPLVGQFSFAKKFIYRKKKHQFNDQHYWEIGKAGYPLRRIKQDIEKIGWKIEQGFLNQENHYHYFFILRHRD